MANRRNILWYDSEQLESEDAAIKARFELVLDEIMGIFYGLCAAFCWGLGDYVVTSLARRAGTPRTMVYIQAWSLLCWIALLILPARLLWGLPSVALWHGLLQTEGALPIWAWVTLAGLCHVLGLALSYRAFEIGTLALVSPISSSFAIVTALLAVSTRESPPPPVLLGVALLFAGLVLATRPQSGPDEAAKGQKGVPEAIGSAVAYGVMFWMMKPVEAHLGPVLPLIVLKVMATGLALLGLRAAQRTLTSDAPSDEPRSAATLILMLAIGSALLDSLAWLAFNAGDRLGFTTVVTALASLFSVVTIILAWLLFKERLARVQWLGIAVILLGVLLVSVPADAVSRFFGKSG